MSIPVGGVEREHGIAVAPREAGARLDGGSLRQRSYRWPAASLFQVGLISTSLTQTEAGMRAT